jgi:hypothetical protein
VRCQALDQSSLMLLIPLKAVLTEMMLTWIAVPVAEFYTKINR